MKVFISWSGDTGRTFAKLLHSWLPSVLQAVKPFFSPDDIAKGARWSSEVGTELEASQVGIIVVTRDSLSAPWIMFEAGALSKNIGRAKVVPILVDLEPADVRGPLLQFQAARFDAVDIKRVLRMLNSELQNLSLTEDVLESVFTMWWPTLEKQVTLTLRSANNNKPANVRSERELLEEILGLSRSIAQRQSEERQPEERQPETQEGSVSDWSGSLTLETVQTRLSSGGDLIGANLNYSNLAGLDLTGAKLRGANLVQANLSQAKLIDADFNGANLEGAVLDGADLKGANMTRVNLWCASMRDVKNLDAVKSMDEANCYAVELNDHDRKTVSEHDTLSIGTYAELFDYYREKGMSKAELRDLFLWTSHSYPNEPL